MSDLETAERFLLSGILHDAIANIVFKVRSMDDADLDYYIDYFLAPMMEGKYTPEMKAKIIEFIWTMKHARVS